MPAVSIIMPAYNAEKTLAKAIDSILVQTLEDIELIIINDGSKDETLAIAKKYAEKDSRVRIINKEINEGLSAARNSGISISTGEYIGTIDSDDWAEADMFERLYNGVNGGDVAVIGYFHDSMAEDGTVAVSTKNCVPKALFTDRPEEIVKWAVSLDNMRLFAYCCNKIYKRTLLQEDNSLKFADIPFIEDFKFNCNVWSKLNSMALVEGCGFHYIKQSESALTQRYVPEFYNLMEERYCLIRGLFQGKYEIPQDTMEKMATVHVKHLFAAITRYFNPVAGFSSKKIKDKIRKILESESCNEAIKHAKGSRKQEKVCNMVMKTKKVFLVYLFAKIIYKMQNSKGKLFDKVK